MLGSGTRFRAKTVPSLWAPPWPAIPYRVEPLSVQAAHRAVSPLLPFDSGAGPRRQLPSALSTLKMVAVAVDLPPPAVVP